MADYGGYMQVAGVAYNTVSTWFAAAAQRENYRAQAAIAASNARMAERGAQSALHAGERQIAAHTLAVGQRKSAQRVRLAANGLDLGEGSAAELLASSDIIKDWEVQDMRLGALYQAFGYRQQAVNFQHQASAARAGAKSTVPWQATVGSLLGNASQVSSLWSQGSR